MYISVWQVIIVVVIIVLMGLSGLGRTKQRVAMYAAIVPVVSIVAAVLTSDEEIPGTPISVGGIVMSIAILYLINLPLGLLVYWLRRRLVTRVGPNQPSDTGQN